MLVERLWQDAAQFSGGRNFRPDGAVPVEWCLRQIGEYLQMVSK